MNLYWTHLNLLLWMSSLCFRNYATVGPGGVSVLTRAPLSKLEGNFTYHLFADIPVLEKNNALAFPGFIRTKLFGESLSPIFYVAAALITFRWGPSSSGFFLCPSTPAPQRKKFGSRTPRPRTNSSRHKLCNLADEKALGPKLICGVFHQGWGGTSWSIFILVLRKGVCLGVSDWNQKSRIC